MGRFLLPLLAALALACDASQGGDEFGGRKSPVVESLVLAPEVIQDRVDLVGQLETADSVVIRPELSGIVAEVLFAEGMPVAKGEPLVRLHSAEQQARLAEAKAEMTLAEDVYRRTRTLADRDARSAAELIRAQSSLEIAGARVQLAQVQLDRTLIRAPFDGVMGARQVSPGQRVTPGGGGDRDGAGTGLGRIESLHDMELIFTVPETVLSLIEKGAQLKLRVAPYPGESFPGEVFFVAPRVNEANRRVLVKASVPNPEHKLRPGLFANVDVTVAERPAALMLPEEAVVFSPSGPTLWRIDAERRTHRVPVELGLRQDGRVEVLSGAAPGDEIVTAGTHKLVEGKPVEVLGRPAAPDPAPGMAEAAPEEAPPGSES